MTWVIRAFRFPRLSCRVQRPGTLPTRPFSSEGGTTLMVLGTFTRKPRPESGLGCLTCAEFARQRLVIKVGASRRGRDFSLSLSHYLSLSPSLFHSLVLPLTFSHSLSDGISHYLSLSHSLSSILSHFLSLSLTHSLTLRRDLRS